MNSPPPLKPGYGSSSPRSASTGSGQTASPLHGRFPVDSCISFAANILAWDPENMLLLRQAAAAAASAACTTASSPAASAAASRKTRCYIDLSATPEGFFLLTFPRSALEPRAVDAKKAEAPFQIPLHRLTVHRASSRLLLCADANGGAGGAQHEGKDEALSEIEGGASETVDTLFGLEFESNESQTSFLSALKSLRQQQSGLSKGGAAGRGGHLHKMEGASVSSYFGYYARHSTQRDMLRDPTRTAAYKAAITQNCRDFRNKKVLDVGAGSGILSFFAAMQGAHKVYAVEASEMAATARLLASGNPSFGSLVEVLQQPVETVELQQLGGERVDVLVSEPLGTFLFNERMIESYLYARDHLLKPGGLMFPRRSRLFCAPFSDASLFAEVSCRGSFWENQNFYGVDLRGAVSAATDEAFRQPIVDYVDPRSLVATPQCTEYDFATLHPTDLHDINLKFSFEVTTPSVLHGVATWFTVEFEGSDFCVGFTTGPDGPPTHWFQLRLLMRPPLAVNAGQTVDVHLRMLATPQQSYKISGRMSLVGTEFSSTCAEVDLKVGSGERAHKEAAFRLPFQQQVPLFAGWLLLMGRSGDS
ncbi:histone arginine methyltransferase prmt4 carm1 [Cyclospora cayetanensis]|uniref:type I protein arginine methyltransferase n=1 Tax=Cyclospora cayetanensis TaxID=88456 RepID=A0A1D3D619_9EIME|nr:histone arginine methyltransferase prmt4 carm1 [Cyclospora cayetanensis]